MLGRKGRSKKAVEPGIAAPFQEIVVVADLFADEL